MGEAAVKVSEVECKWCELRAENREARRKCDQVDLDELVETVGRLKLIGRTLWEFETFDKEERGTVALMLNKEADHIFALMENLSDRLGE